MHEKRPGGIVIFVVRPPHILLQFRDPPPTDGTRILNPNTWAAISGGVEDGETIVEAAQRELREELSLTSKLDLLGISAKLNGFFFARITSEEAGLAQLGEGQGYGFFKPGALDHLPLGGALKIYWERYRETITHMIETGIPPSGKSLGLATWNGQ